LLPPVLIIIHQYYQTQKSIHTRPASFSDSRGFNKPQLSPLKTFCGFPPPLPLFSENHRIIKVENGKVFFRYKDYAHNNKIKIMSVDTFEFIRWFLLHVLPDRFVKIRCYGLLSQRNRKDLLEECRALLAVVPEEMDAIEIPPLPTGGEDLTRCPFCGEGKMIL